jgi:hypothetical protein
MGAPVNVEQEPQSYDEQGRPQTRVIIFSGEDMCLRPLFNSHEESAFDEMSLPLEVLHTRIGVEISQVHTLTG